MADDGGNITLQRSWLPILASVTSKPEMVAVVAPVAVVFAQVSPPLLLTCHWYAMVQQHPGSLV